jgi:hypothetical protein
MHRDAAPGWPDAVQAVFERSLTAEYASLTRLGTPVTVPTTPYLGRTGTLDVSTGLTYPTKAERARRDPRVCLLFADPVGSGLERPPVALVQGLATVRDADLQANTDRYVAGSLAKLPEATKGQPKVVLRRMAWYYARIWIEITPLHVRWWPDRNLAGAPESWDAYPDTAAPLSDPPPGGIQPGAWKEPAPAWRPVAEDALARLPLPDLTVVGDNGFPLCLPVSGADLDGDDIRLRLGPGTPALAGGAACLTFHTHPEAFTGQENRTLIGTVTPAGDGVTMRVERALADWSLAGNRARMAVAFLRTGRTLGPRIKAECDRRDQPVPKVRFP